MNDINFLLTFFFFSYSTNGLSFNTINMDLPMEVTEGNKDNFLHPAICKSLSHRALNIIASFDKSLQLI